MTSAQLIHKDSKICAQSELDLFNTPPTIGQVEKTTCLSYRPSSTVSDNSLIEFFVAGTGDEYLDLQGTKLHLVVSVHDAKTQKRITVKDNFGPATTVTSEAGTSSVKKFGPAPVNNFLHSLFQQLDVFLNDKLVSTSNNLYPYRAYMENLLNYGSDATDSHLSCSLFYPDTAGKLEDDNLLNLGMDMRIVEAYSQDTFDLIGNLHSDVFHQNRYMLSNVDMKIRLMRSRTEFCLFTKTPEDAGYKVTVHEATLYVHKVKIAPSLILAHAQLLGKQAARYPFHRVEMKSFTIPSGSSMMNRDNLVLGQLPSQIIVGLVDSEAENGDYKRNPFNFKHFSVNYLSLQVGSEQFPSIALTPNFKSGQYIREYQSLLDAVGYWHIDKGIQITRQSFLEGYTLYGFNLTPTQQKKEEAGRIEAGKSTDAFEVCYSDTESNHSNLSYDIRKYDGSGPSKE